MESTSVLSPSISPSTIAISGSPSPTTDLIHQDTMIAPPSEVFLKMEDLHSSPTPSSSADSPSFDQTTANGSQQFAIPPPVIVHSKPAKKRKSWGQELPEPKTALPPRKRAKTDDEKEQRRIERIKRNRAAAHNSRERKRQETETLAVALARANAELSAYRRLHGPLPESVVLPEVTLCTEEELNVPTLTDSRSSVDATSPSSPNDLQFDYDVAIKQENSEPSFQAPLFAQPVAKPASLKPLDPTQHSAAMLCDLQCRSSRGNNSTASAIQTTTHSFWALFFLHVITLQLKTTYQTILLALWTTSPSRMAHLTRASMLRSISPLTNSSTTTSRMSRPNMALAQHNAATATFAARLGAATAHALAALPRSSLPHGSPSERESSAVAYGLQGHFHRKRLLKLSSHECQSSDEGRIGSEDGLNDQKGLQEEN